MIQRIFILFFSCLFSCFVFSRSPDVEDISYALYFPAVKKLIQEAESEIKISVYYITLTPKGPVSELLDELVKAKERGVDIEVVLDFSTREGKNHSEDMKNAKAYSFLKQKGIRVFYDDDKRLNHSKYMIVDKKIVVVGSFNWCVSAFEKNHENALLVRLPEIAAVYLGYFRALPRILSGQVKGAVPIPAELLKNPALGAGMVKTNKERMMDFYLLCQKLSWEQKSKVVRITEDVLEDNFFKREKMKLTRKEMRRYFISNFFRKYKYQGGIPFMKSYRHIRKEKVIEVELFSQNTGEKDAVWLPEIYWTGRWFERLEASGKFFLLSLLHKTDSLKLGRSFQISLERMQEEYGLSLSALGLASKELHRYNLLEKQNYSRRDDYKPNIYLLNDFYLYEDFEKGFLKIKEGLPPDLFEVIVKICDITNEPHDLEAMKKLALIGSNYGKEILKSAYEKAEKSEYSSPYREFSYLMGVINSWVKEGPDQEASETPLQ